MNRPGNTSRIISRPLPPPPPPAQPTDSNAVSEQWGRQERYLAALRVYGTVRRAIEACGIGRNRVARWRNDDAQGFRQREQDAWEDFIDGLEEILYENVRGDEPSPKLLLAALRAHRRNRWGDHILIQADKSGEILARLCAIPSEDGEEIAKTPTDEA